ncbi:MAG: hypothetical protein AABX66_01045 [Nanoarchaeota archaeon]
MKSELEQIKQKLEKKKNRIGLVGTRLRVEEVRGKSLAAYITTDWKEIGISYGEDLNLVPDEETQSFVYKKSMKDVLLEVGEDILQHETGHRENKVGERYGCPYDIETHERIKDAITRGLDSVGKKGLETYVTNAFEDVLDNVNCRRHTNFAGQTLFWNNQGIVNSERGKFNPFYEAFVKINLRLAGNASDYTLLRRFFTGKEEVDEAVNGFLGEMKTMVQEENVFRLHEKKGFEKLFNRRDLKQRAEMWGQLGYNFAVNLGKLLDDIPKQKMFGSGEGDENSEERNPFDREMKMPINRQNVAFGRYQAGEVPLAHRNLEEQLYDLYRRISKEVPVETTHYSASQSMPLVRFGRRFVKEDERKFKFKGIGLKDGEWEVRTTKHQIDYPVSYKKHPHKFPNFKLALIDRSGSMALNTKNETDASGNPVNIGNTSYISWGDNSKHHFALKGYFGIDNFFERQGVGQYIENRVIGFSGESSVRGNSALVAKSLLTKPSGGTSLDINGLESELEENSLVLSISDGEFSIDDTQKTRFEAKVRTSDYAHIQIGGDTAFSNYLKGIGIPVVNVNGDDDLSKAMVSFVSSYYKQSPKIIGGSE